MAVDATKNSPNGRECNQEFADLRVLGAHLLRLGRVLLALLLEQKDRLPLLVRLPLERRDLLLEIIMRFYDLLGT